ncbi:hypothetical protein OG373_41000 [Streptomyces avidinii]|uniref:hypothetical protein n=1 Tax=Streptomyces avidinii TaxID=1895 RepID=UPI00386744DB|nr:hypothetical protein OG373_00170 [Streptomyces avidinii]WTB02234.1 hypothetical protein OG373_41000 [Streptomyces avidinii]
MTIEQDEPAGMPERTLHHASDITEDDAWAIFEFLMPRLEAQEAAHGAETEEHRTAGALAQVMSGLVLQLEWDIRAPFWKPYRNRSGPTTVLVWAPPPEAELRAQDEQRLDRIRDTWNTLCEALRSWHDSEGYDVARWHKVDFRDAAAAALYEQRVSDLGLRREKR